MIPIHTIFGGLLILFAVIGSLRGWGKEIIVSSSVLLALFVEHVLLTLVPPTKSLFENLNSPSQFYTRAVLFIIITVFGYASPTIATKLGAKIAREQLQDLLLGFFLGLINGFLIVGTLLSFLNTAYYGIPPEMRPERQVVDDNGDPVLDESGQPVMEVVYLPGAEGIGGITPPQAGSAAANLMAFMPPKLVEGSSTMLYVAVAAAFVFVIVVFI